MIVKRSIYLDQLKQFLFSPVVKIITGMRRSGKTFLLQQVKSVLEASTDNQVIYIDKEDLDFDDIKNYKDLNLYVKKVQEEQKKVFVLIDEVQEIFEWERAVRSFVKKDIEVIITGSNSQLLSSELATFISGRYIEIQVFPLSFKEFLDFRLLSEKALDLENEFDRFLRFGSMPGIHNLELKQAVVYPYIKAILNTVLLKDIVRRNSIQNYSNFEKLYLFIFENIGSTFSAKSITDFLKSQQIKISVDTVQNYLSFLQAAYLIHKVQRYDLKGKKLLEIHEKYFLSDLGFRHASLKYRPEDINDYIENIVFLELKSRSYEVTIGKLDNLEIDFIASKNDEKLYFQIAYSIADEKTLERELKPLIKLKDNHPKYILHLDKHFSGTSQDGIKILNLLNWLRVS